MFLWSSCAPGAGDKAVMFDFVIQPGPPVGVSLACAYRLSARIAYWPRHFVKWIFRIVPVLW